MAKKQNNPSDELHVQRRKRASGPRSMLGFLLNQFADRMAVETRHALVPFEITPRDLGILLSLEDGAPRSQLDLGRQLRLDRTTIGHMIDRLEKNGWLTRVMRPEDRRLNTVELTDHGRRRLSDAKAAAIAVEETLVACLKPAAVEQLKQALASCIDHVGK